MPPESHNHDAVILKTDMLMLTAGLYTRAFHVDRAAGDLKPLPAKAGRIWGGGQLAR